MITRTMVKPVAFLSQSGGYSGFFDQPIFLQRHVFLQIEGSYIISSTMATCVFINDLRKNLL